MGIYSKHVFPRILNLVMSNGYMKKARNEVLQNVEGDIFEIGFGTGLNLPHYPESVKKITTADVNPAMGPLAQRQIDASPIEVDNRVLNGEDLPLDDASFDTVVCTWTLCSIEKVDKALQEMHRILRPGGRFVFVEHGLADDPATQRWQNRLNPLQRIIGDGCNLNRNMKELILDNHFSMVEFKNFVLEKSPKTFGYMYQGMASKAGVPQS